MRSPHPAFDLRAALSTEVRGASEEFDAADARPKSIHRCRVRLKRARALARVGRACAPGLATVFEDSARAAMAALSQERDLTALADAARSLADKSPRRAAKALEAIAQRLDAERALLPKPDAEATRATLRDLLALAQVWPEASARQIARGAKRILRRARHARRKGARSDEPARRHAWRKREKDRFYAALLLGEAFPAKRRRRLGEKLTILLGAERDIMMLLERLATNPAWADSPQGAERAVAVLTKRRESLGRRADRLGARLHARGA